MNLIWIIVIVLVALLVLGLVLLLTKKAKDKKTERNLQAAQEHRAAAREEIGDVRERQQTAAAAQARAEEARLEAERAERVAHESQSEARAKEARVEEHVRTADKLDPDVDHKSKDYTPDASRLHDDPAQSQGQGQAAPQGHDPGAAPTQEHSGYPESRDLHGDGADTGRTSHTGPDEPPRHT